MEYRRFGKTELRISVLTFGGMRVVDPVGLDQGIATIRRCLDAGITHLETARFYGNSEEVIREALQGVPRSDVVLTTKIPPMPADMWRDRLDESLERLGVSYIDNVDIHGINTDELLYYATKENGAIEAARKAQDEGLVGHLGFSTHGPLEIILKTIDTDEFSSVNLHYYYIRQRNLPAIERALAKDMGVLIISPTDKGGKLFAPPPVLSDLCAPQTPAVLNHRFCLTTPGVTTCTIGPKHPDEVELHLPAADGERERTAEEHARIAGLDAHVRATVGADFCTQCYECLPCPENIEIPRILGYRNLAVGLDMGDYGNYRYNMIGQADHWMPKAQGNACTDCDECLPRCPERLPIPRLLRDTHARLAGDAGTRLWAAAED